MSNGISAAQKNLEKKLALYNNKNNHYPLELPKLTQLKDTLLSDNIYEHIVHSYKELLKEMKQKAIDEKNWNKHSSFVHKKAQESYEELSQYNETSLKNIPPILLAESYAEYLKIADACAGFSSDWEKKLPW